MHLLVLRRTLVNAQPALADALYTAFDQARALAAADLVSRDFPKVMLPWLTDHASTTHAQLGCDLWAYGFEANSHALNTMLHFCKI